MAKRAEAHIPDIILVDKPSGITSFDVVRALRKTYGVRKIGHAGTLDPLATGLLVVGIGAGTKKLAEYLKLPKVYTAEIRLGVETETGDLDGRVVREERVGRIQRVDVVRALRSMEGKIALPVPAYSAIKSGGVPLYRRARRGERVMPPRREMEVHDTKFLGLQREGECSVVRAEFHVGSGTYVRSLAEELGRRLGYPAALQALRRTKIGTFDVRDAQQLSR